jgi:thiol-disulfide isomerase/thioredoxin
MLPLRPLLVVLLLAVASAAAQPSGDGIPFAAVFAEATVPAFGPVERMGLEDVRTARIPLPDTSQTLSVVWGTRYGGPDYLVLHQTPTSTSFIRFGGIGAGSDEAKMTVDLELTPGATDRTPLEVRVLRDSNLVLYWWPLSQTSAAGGRPTARPNPLALGQVAPDLVVETLGGETVRLSDYRGRVVVLNWWSVTCSPCIEELPALNGLAEAFGDRAAFVAVAWDSVPEVEALLGRFAFDYRQTVGDADATSLFGEAFPRHVVLDAEGRVVFDQIGGSADVAETLRPGIEAALGG